MKALGPARRAGLLVFGISAVASRCSAWFSASARCLADSPPSAWSRSPSGRWRSKRRRRALDRVMTVVIVEIFVLALVPLISPCLHGGQRRAGPLRRPVSDRGRTGVVGEGGGAFTPRWAPSSLPSPPSRPLPVGVLAAIYLVEYGGAQSVQCLFRRRDDGIPRSSPAFAFALFALFSAPASGSESWARSP